MKYVTLIGLFSGAMLCVASVGFAIDFEDHAQKANQVTPLTMHEAIKVAILHFPWKVRESELEDEHGQSLYEITIANETGVSQEPEVDAHSGSILSRGQGELDETP